MLIPGTLLYRYEYGKKQGLWETNVSMVEYLIQTGYLIQTKFLCLFLIPNTTRFDVKNYL